MDPEQTTGKQQKRKGDNTVVNVYRVTSIKHAEDGTVSNVFVPAGAYRRSDRVPEEIRTASIYENMPGTEDTLGVLIEGVRNED